MWLYLWEYTMKQQLLPICAGQNDYGGLGDNTNVEQTIPVAVWGGALWGGALPPPPPSPPPPPPSPPGDTKAGKPGKPRTVAITSTTWKANWTDSEPQGLPTETYSLKCVGRDRACRAQAVGTPAANIARGTREGTVTGLTAGKKYTCFVVASNAAGQTCSNPRNIMPGTKAGKPRMLQTVAITSTTWRANWTDSEPQGQPTETYSLKCVGRDRACRAPAAGTPAAKIARGTREGTVTGLTAGKKYTCFVVASNALGKVCSGKLGIATPAS